MPNGKGKRPLRGFLKSRRVGTGGKALGATGRAEDVAKFKGAYGPPGSMRKGELPPILKARIEALRQVPYRPGGIRTTTPALAPRPPTQAPLPTQVARRVATGFTPQTGAPLRRPVGLQFPPTRPSLGPQIPPSQFPPGTLERTLIDVRNFLGGIPQAPQLPNLLQQIPPWLLSWLNRLMARR